MQTVLDPSVLKRDCVLKSNPKFAKLLGPAQSGQLELKNRMVLAAMGLNYASEDGYISEREKEFYGERARGGVGTIILGVGCVDLVGKLMTHQICIYDDKFIPGLTEMAETIQRHGAKALIQLQHGGRYSRPERNGGHQPVAPSPILMPGVVPGREQPGELTVEEIAQLAERFAEAAEQAKRVVVVGGGPAGMEAARMAALKGHQVTLYEKGRRLGGSLQYASVLSRENEQLLTYLVAQTKKLPVEIKLGEEVAPGLIEGMNPDTTTLAVGPNLVPPQIPGGGSA